MSEPDLDRVLVEADPEAGVTTAFTLEPLKDGRQTRVAVATEVTDCPGFRGFVEKLLNPTITRRIFKKELKQVADYVGRKTTSENNDSQRFLEGTPRYG